ncbi:MAG: beta-N-acetylhexosaminidase [Bacteroidales bacterium]|nr:beta-N-acetylhexosaminidase [Bacteroidales bacterium]
MKMNRFFPAVVAALAFLLSACSDESKYAVVPQPESIKALCCNSCKVPANLPVYAADESLKAVASTWAETIQKSYAPGVDSTAAKHVRIVSDVVLPTVSLTDKVEEAVLCLSLDSTMAADAYRLTVDKKGIQVVGGEPKAVFWGLQSLSQILLQEKANAKGERKLDGVAIEDSPRFAHRGALLDCCRHFFSVDEVKTFIDMLAINKMNIFHWHLTEDQGWRIEIKKYPKLTEIGSVRKQTVVGRHSKVEEENVYDGVQYGPFFYTQDQASEIVAYAAARFITVIPEIEMPGHCLGAIAAYPWLSCDPKPREVQCKWGVFADGVVCLAKESTYQFYEDVLDEICDIFPSEYIHIGGDEAPRDHWKTCKKCQALMKKHGFAKEAELQTYLNARIEAYLNAKGRKIIGWDEILEGGVSPSATVMSWRGSKGGIAAAKQGNHVIMTPNSHCYMDYYQTCNPDSLGENLAPKRHYLPLQTCFEFNPFDQLNEEESAYVIGLQANVWCEFIKTFDHVQFMTLPRISALAEVAWSKNPTGDYDGFVRRMEKAMIPTYEYHGYVYAPYVFNGKDKYAVPKEKFVKPAI